MKQFIILFWLLFSFSISAQNWTSVKETNVWVGSAPNFGVDIYTNRYGNHIIVQRPNELKYFKMNVNGTATDSVVIEENSSVITPSITGDNDKVYIVYRKTNENFIRIKYLSSGGTSVQSLSNLNIGNANWIESVMSNNKLHVTYEVSNIIYYSYYVFETSSWSAQLTVSTGEPGIIPRITAWYDSNDDKVYFMYKRQSSSDIKWREYDVTTGSWTSNPKLAISYGGSEPAGFAVGNSTISFYYEIWNYPYWYFQWIVKHKSNNSTICTFEPPDLNSTSYYLNSTTTYDGNVYVPLWLNFAQPGDELYGLYRSNGYDCSWEQIYYNDLQLGQNINFINVSSASNDVYVIWQDDSISQNLRLIYDDKDPLAPQNLNSYLDTDPYCNNCHGGSGPGIRLDWDKNNEADLSQYIIYRSLSPGNCNDCHQASNSNPEDSLSNPDPLNETVTLHQNCPALSEEITDFTKSKVEVETGCQSGLESTQILTFKPIWAWSQNWWMDISITLSNYTYIYFVSAIDATENQSSESNFTLTYVPPGLSKGLVPFSGDVVPKIYFLYQNYPNPFNPVTTIRYQVPNETSVRIEIFNVVGQKVKTLVNEFKAEGYYSIEWNGKDDFEQPLTSGIYLYKMTAGSFSDTKKMLLIK